MTNPEDDQPFVRLTLFNPKREARRGTVITAWDPVRKALGLPDSALGVRVELETWDQETGKTGLSTLNAQIDRCDTNDPKQDVLVFALDRDIPGGADDYHAPTGRVRVYAADRNESSGANVWEERTGVGFSNEQLEFFLNTEPYKEPQDELNPEKHYWGGAVTTVQVYGLEMLDAIAACQVWNAKHHPEKRAMQIDRIHLVRPPWDGQRSINVHPFRTPWRKVFLSRGPVRAAATIASAPYTYKCLGADKSELVYDCETFRTVALEPDSDLITDEVWVKATLRETGATVPFWFRARYFMMNQLTIDATTFRYPDHPGWFTMTCPTHPNHGYAFATDALAGAIWNPPLDYADPHTEHRAYEWELGTSRRTHCVHIFRLGTNPKDLADAAGRAWYDFSFRPIRATLEAAQ